MSVNLPRIARAPLPNEAAHENEPRLAVPSCHGDDPMTRTLN